MNFRSVNLIHSLAQLNGFYTIYILSKQRKIKQFQVHMLNNNNISHKEIKTGFFFCSYLRGQTNVPRGSYTLDMNKCKQQNISNNY